MKTVSPLEALARHRLAAALGGIVGVLACTLFTVYAFSNTLSGVTGIQEWVKNYNQALSSGEVLIELRDDDAVGAIGVLRGLTLPPSASSVRYAREGRVHTAYWIRFELPPADLDAFLDSTCFDAPLSDTVPTFAYNADETLQANLDWWTPAESTRAVGGECALDGGVTFRLLVDQTAARLWTVYLEIVTT